METFSALLALCAGNSQVTGEFPTQKPQTRSFDVFFDLRLNKRWSKQSWGWWFETPSRSLWHYCNVRNQSICRWFKKPLCSRDVTKIGSYWNLNRHVGKLAFSKFKWPWRSIIFSFLENEHVEHRLNTMHTTTQYHQAFPQIRHNTETGYKLV